MERDLGLLNMLLQGVSPSGSESGLIHNWAERLIHTGKFKMFYQDKLGQIGMSIGHGPTRIVLGAHIDSVFARVLYVDKHGLVHLKQTGGTDRDAFICNEVIIVGKHGNVHGVVGKAPIHIEQKVKEHEYTDLKEVVVNIGAETKEEAEAMGVIPGVPVVYERRVCLEFGQNRMHATELDDKIGVYIITKVLEELANDENGEWADKYTVIAVPLVQEEVGGTGAMRVAKNINPDVCFNYDVDHAQDYVQVKEEKVGDIELGKGGMVMYGCDKSQRIVDLVSAVCDVNNIPYQTCASRNRGTDTVHFQQEAMDCETMLISIPNIYMHTAVEVCDWRDVNSIIEMTTKTIQSCML